MTTGEIIKDLLQKTGKSQAELSRFLGVSPNTVNRWIPTETKQGGEPSEKNIKKIAEFFQVSTDIIKGDSGEYGSEKHMEFIEAKMKKWEAFEQLLNTFGYELKNDSYNEETNTVESPKEYTISWGNGIDSEERFMKAVDLDCLLRKLEKHIRIEIEEYY